MARGRGDKWQIGNTQLTLGGIALYGGDLVRAEARLQESLMLFRELRNKDGTASALSSLGDIRRRQSNLTQAKALCIEGMLLAMEAGSRYSIGWNLIILAMVSTDEGQAEQAARLFGTAEPWLPPSTMDPLERVDYERAVESVRAQLGEKAFATAWAEGRTLSPEQALAVQEQAKMPASASITLPLTYPAGLTAREVEILRLVTRGLTDAQVAEQLVISPRTFNTHLTSIFSKIGVTSRSAATRYAIEHQIV